MKQVIWQRRGLDWLKQSAMSSFVFMIIVCDEISLEAFGGSADHNFYQKITQFELLPNS
jgi:hypothetical protein